MHFEMVHLLKEVVPQFSATFLAGPPWSAGTHFPHDGDDDDNDDDDEAGDCNANDDDNDANHANDDDNGRNALVGKHFFPNQ